jgi:spore maturation protein CgeB
MKIYMFYHSVISDWNNGNAHFLRGIITSLQLKRHKVKIYEPKNGWSLYNLIHEQGIKAYEDFWDYFPFHDPGFYSEDHFNPEKLIHDADLVIVHEWTHPEVVRKIGEYKSKNNRFILLFHDTHHRMVSNPEEMRKYNLRNYDGILAFGNSLRDVYIRSGCMKQVWTWHEAADDHVFFPHNYVKKEGDLVWIGNWGDEERTEELMEFIITPVKKLGIKASFYGVRYPSYALKILKDANIEYKGWVPNFKVPEVFSKYNVTVHVPRKPYMKMLPGIPTIRPFEAMSCGIPLISSPWDDKENLFTPGKDFLVAQNGKEMEEHLKNVLNNPELSKSLTNHGLKTIREKHTCDHRVNELINVFKSIENSRIEKILSAITTGTLN